MICPSCWVNDWSMEPRPDHAPRVPSAIQMRRIVRAGDLIALTNLYGGHGQAGLEFAAYECPECGFTARFRQKGST